MILAALALTLFSGSAEAVVNPPRFSSQCFATLHGVSVTRSLREGALTVDGMAEEGCQALPGGELVELRDVRLTVAANGEAQKHVFYISSPSGTLVRDSTRGQEQIAVSSRASVVLDGVQIAHNGLIIDMAKGHVRSSNGFYLTL